MGRAFVEGEGEWVYSPMKAVISIYYSRPDLPMPISFDVLGFTGAMYFIRWRMLIGKDGLYMV